MFGKGKHFLFLIMYVKEYRRGNQKLTIQRNGQHRVHRKTKQKHNTICLGHHYVQTNTSNVNKTCSLLQTTGGKNEPNIVFMQKSYQTPTVLLVYINVSKLLQFNIIFSGRYLVSWSYLPLSVKWEVSFLQS